MQYTTRTFLKTLPLLAGLAFGFAACGSKYYFEAKQDIPNGLWTYADTLDFRFSMPDTSGKYNLYLDLDYADTFPNQNLYLRLHTRFPDGKRLSKQLSFDFFDAQGAPTGQCSGHTCRLHALLQEKAFFNEPGEYVITVEQFSRRDSLAGVAAVGVAVEAAGKK